MHSGISYIEELKPLNIHTQREKLCSVPTSARNNFCVMGEALSLMLASEPLSTWFLNKIGTCFLSGAGTARRCNGFKLKEGRFRLDRRKRLCTARVVRPWHRLPREVVDAPSLETFQVKLDRALSNLIQLKTSLLMAGGLDRRTFTGPFQPKLFYDSMVLTSLKRCRNTLSARLVSIFTAVIVQERVHWSIFLKYNQPCYFPPSAKLLTICIKIKLQVLQKILNSLMAIAPLCRLPPRTMCCTSSVKI